MLAREPPAPLHGPGAPPGPRTATRGQHGRRDPPGPASAPRRRLRGRRAGPRRPSKGPGASPAPTRLLTSLEPAAEPPGTGAGRPSEPAAYLSSFLFFCFFPMVGQPLRPDLAPTPTVPPSDSAPRPAPSGHPSLPAALHGPARWGHGTYGVSSQRAGASPRRLSVGTHGAAHRELRARRLECPQLARPLRRERPLPAQGRLAPTPRAPSASF